MYTYIKLDIKGSYFPIDEKLVDKYFPIGTTYEDYLDNKFVLLTEEQVNFHYNNPQASVKEVFNLAFDPIPEPTLEEVKVDVQYKITDFYETYVTHPFIFKYLSKGKEKQLQPYVCDDEKNGVNLTIQATKTLQTSDKMQFYIGGTEVSATPEEMEKTMAKLQIYENMCLVNYNRLIKSLTILKTKEDVKKFNYKVNYPDKIIVNL